MSKMKELYEKVSADSVLKAKFADIFADSDSSNAEDVKDKLIAFAKEAGYTVSYEEMQEFFKDLEDKSGELSEVELDSVAGGKNSGEIAHSFTSLGAYCAAVSIKYEVKGKDCGERFA